MMFLRNCWYVAGWSHDIAADSLVSRTMLGEPIVLYRKADSGVVAKTAAVTGWRRCREGASRGMICAACITG